jgi:hypothetical protein
MSKLDLRSQVLDAIRIILWKSWSKENKNNHDTILKWYEDFEKEVWSIHEFHSMTLQDIMKSIPDYTVEELLKFRLNYYQKKAEYDKVKKVKINLEKIYLM